MKSSSRGKRDSGREGQSAILFPFIYAFTVVRALGAFVLLPLLTLFTSTTVIIYGAIGRDESAITYHMWLWSRIVLWYFGVDVISEGFEKIPERGGGILAFNHQSHFDIPAITGSSRRLVRYGAKIELFSIPVFGQAIRVAGCLPIARDNRKEVFRIYADASIKFKQGIVYALAPEGSRQSVPGIAPFKKGPFVFAVNAGVPIIPVVVEGADRVLPKGLLLVNLGRLRQTIRVRVLDPIYSRDDLDKNAPRSFDAALANRNVVEAVPGVLSASASSPAVLELLERTRAAMVENYAQMQSLAAGEA